MKSFDFIFYCKCAGNLLMHILLLISYLPPRNKNKWLVGNARGFNNNTKYFFIHTKEVLHKKECYWISKNKKCRQFVRQLGYKAYHPWSFAGLYHLLTAKVYVYDSHISALNFWTSGRVLKVNLWHGVGIKNIEFKRKIDKQSKQSRLNYLRRPVNYVRPDLFLSTSPMMTTHFAECFRIPESRCIESEYPRCVIFRKSEDELLTFIATYESTETQQLVERLRQASRSYVYMPTFRETKDDFMKKAGFDLPALEAVLKERNELFLFKLHPFTRIKVDASLFKHILFMDNKMDIYPVLPFTDVLITDYSSIYYDYLLLPEKEILLFPFDYAEYVSQERDLAFDFDEFTPGMRCYLFNDMLEAIRTGQHFYHTKKEWITDIFWKSDHPQDLYQAISSHR